MQIIHLISSCYK